MVIKIGKYTRGGNSTPSDISVYLLTMSVEKVGLGTRLYRINLPIDTPNNTLAQLPCIIPDLGDHGSFAMVNLLLGTRLAYLDMVSVRTNQSVYVSRLTYYFKLT